MSILRSNAQTGLATGVLVLLGTALLLSGCDLSEDEDLSPLLGSWTIQEVEVDGVDRTPNLDAKFVQLVLSFRESGEGTEFFNVVGERENEGAPLDVRGQFDLDNDDREVTFFPDDGTSITGSITLDFARPGPNRLQLSAEEDGDEDRFLALLELDVQGEVDRLVVRLASESGVSSGRSRSGRRGFEYVANGITGYAGCRYPCSASRAPCSSYVSGSEGTGASRPSM
jgi:hypothetical protein